MKLRRATQFLAAAASAALACEVRAQLVYEPFNYSAASNLDTQINAGNSQPWSHMGGTPTDEVVVTSPSLSYSGLFPSSGNAVSYSGVGNSQRLAIGPVISSGTTYYSLTLNVTGLAGMTTSPTFVAGFSPGVGTSGSSPTTIGTRLYLKQTPTSTPQNSSFNIGVSKNSNNPADIQFDPASYTLNTPLLIVGSYSINGTTLGTDDEAKLWINPTALGAAAAPATGVLTAPVAGTDLFNGTPAVAGFVLRQGSQVPDVTVDELRVDTTWAQVTPPAGISWLPDAGGNWSDNVKWSTGVSPNDANNFINFGTVISTPRTVTLDTPVALRTINFNSPHSYAIAGSSALNLSTSAAINVLGGSHTVAAPITMGGDLLLSVRSGGALLLSGNIAANNHSITKAGSGSAQVNNVCAAALNIFGGRMSVLTNGGDAGVSKVNSLAISSAATLDLANNSLVVDYTGASPLGSWNGSTYTGVTGMIASGRGGGSWNGTSGLVTTMTDATSSVLTTLAVGEASDMLQLAAGETTTWRGQTVDASSVLVKYTWGGDADLNGELNGDDYFRIDSNILLSGVVFGYQNGDFNYDGELDGDDYFIIDSNIVFAQNSPPFSDSAASGLSAVPEPTAVSCLFAASTIALRRRRTH